MLVEEGLKASRIPAGHALTPGSISQAAPGPSFSAGEQPENPKPLSKAAHQGCDLQAYHLGHFNTAVLPLSLAEPC